MGGFVSSLLVVSSLIAFALADAPKVKTEDLRLLAGAQWTGGLTYLDYGAKKRVSIPSKLTVTRSADDELTWFFDYQYPDEPKANSKETVTISEDGKVFDGETVVGRSKLGGALRIVTEKRGTDDDKNALFRRTYLLGANSFSIKKEVRYEGTTEFLERNRYSWTR